MSEQLSFQFDADESNDARVHRQLGHLIGRPARWSRTISVLIPGKRPRFVDQQIPCEGFVRDVSAGKAEYSPRIIVTETGGLDWWLPVERVTVLDRAA
jgi:hypothetical protein